MDTLRSILYICIGNALIPVGLTFLAGQLFPTLLEPVYRTMPFLAKLALFLIVVSVPANLLIANAYRLVGPGFAGVTSVITNILITVIVAVLIEGSRVSWVVVLGTLLMLVGGATVVHALRQG